VDISNQLDVISIVVQLIFLEGILSIDNAAVLGAMVSVLPRDKPVPFPKPLKFLQGFTDRYLGMQQMAALKVGLLGAYLGRALMLVIAVWVIENQFLKVLGALYLIKLAFEQLSGTGHLREEEEEGPGLEEKEQARFWTVVLHVELADLAFSLDNVVAAVALSDQLWVVLLGVALGIVTMRFAAGIFTWMIRREPILATAAYIVVLNIGVELLLAEFFHIHFAAWQKFVISVATILLCLLYAHVKFLHVLAPIFHWAARGMGLLNELINWALEPLVVLIKLAFRLIGRVIAPLLDRSPSRQVVAVPDNPGSDGHYPPDLPCPDDPNPG
jgi:tellurite resistance protein TerC